MTTNNIGQSELNTLRIQFDEAIEFGSARSKWPVYMSTRNDLTSADALECVAAEFRAAGWVVRIGGEDCTIRATIAPAARIKTPEGWQP